ncbi:MAG: DMT family transporter, partial [Bacteroidota bacterium]
MQTLLKTPRAKVSPWQAWGILALLSLIWGTSYVLIKWGLVYFSAEQVGGIRLGVSALAFLPIIVREWRKVERKQLPTLFIVGLLGTGIPSFLFPAAQEHVNSSLAGILNSMTPLFTLLLGLLFFGSTFSWAKTGGILLGLAGALFLIVCCDGMGVQSPGSYGVLILGACICYAISSNLVGFCLQGLSA